MMYYRISKTAQLRNTIAPCVGVVYVLQGRTLLYSTLIKYLMLERKGALKFAGSQHTSRDACQRKNYNRNVGNMRQGEWFPLFASIRNVVL